MLFGRIVFDFGSHRNVSFVIVRMIGAGAAAEYCFLCGLPFSDDGFPRETQTDGDVAVLDLEWLEYGIGLDPRRGASIVVHSYDGYGRFQMNGTRKWFCSEDRPSPQCEFSGRVCHVDCSEFVEATLNRRVGVDTMMQLYHQSVAVQSRDYHGQFYRWEEALAAEGAEFFKSPRTEDGYDGYDGSSVQRRIRKCLIAAGMLANSTVTYDELLVACLSASQQLGELALRQRRAKEVGEIPDVAALHTVALTVSDELAYLARECADANRAPQPATANVGAQRASPKCKRLKKGECVKHPDCKWTKGQGCVTRDTVKESSTR